MEKTDISGKKYYKEIKSPPFKWNLQHYCFIAVRTTLNPLDFFASIYQHSDYLFQLSEHNWEMVRDSVCFLFQLFEYQDTLSEHKAFCLVNKSMDKPQYLLGENKNSCYYLSQKWTDNQISFSYEQEETATKKGREEDEWELFKKNMQNASVNLMDKIDYIFPVEIQTYEILKPLFKKFYTLNFLNHQLIPSKNIKQIDALLSQCYAG